MTKAMLLVRQRQFAAAPNNQFRQHGRLWPRCKATFSNRILQLLKKKTKIDKNTTQKSKDRYYF
jgi:hypothetical protein